MLLYCLTILTLTCTVLALPSKVTRAEVLSLINSRDNGASIKAASPFDHSWIDAIAALGDSYAAGLGAGHAISATKGLVLNTDTGCYQYSYGYPNLLNSDSLLGPNSARVLEYLPCSGARIPDVDKQIKKMSNAGMVTLSIGGNDIGFVDIINYCIYQWYTWEPFWTCAKQLTYSKGRITASDYTKSLGDVIKKVEAKLSNANSRIYWTGYEHFWNADTTKCNDVTWGFTKNLIFRQYLTQDHRKQMNELIDALNNAIKAACATVDRCVFIDSNAGVDQIDGHACEEGVDERYKWPGGGVSANREETTFYEWGTTKDEDDSDDKDIDQPQRRDIEKRVVADNSTFEGNVAWLIQEGLKNDSVDTSITQYAYPGFTANTLPGTDYYFKVFHRTKYGNGIVAMNVLKAMDIEQGKMMNQPLVTSTVSLCPKVAAATATPSSGGAPACIGNQIQGTCTQATMPSVTANSGPQAPVCNKVGSNHRVRISDTKAQSAVTEYCNNLITGKIVVDANNPSPKAGTVANAAEDGGTLSIVLLFNAGFCDAKTSNDNQKIDFGKMTAKECYDNFYTILAQTCAEDPSWSGFNKDYPLEGGTWGNKCGLWALSGDKK